MNDIQVKICDGTHNVNLLKTHVKDIDKLSALSMASEDTYSGAFKRDKKQVPYKGAKLVKHLVDRNIAVLLAISIEKDGKKVVGMVELGNSLLHKVCRISTITILPNFRKLGIGALLMQTAEEYAKNTLNMKGCLLTVLAGNKNARGMYSHIGYTEHAITMVKSI